jgi:hypothetical protein
MRKGKEISRRNRHGDTSFLIPLKKRPDARVKLHFRVKSWETLYLVPISTPKMLSVFFKNSLFLLDFFLLPTPVNFGFDFVFSIFPHKTVSFISSRRTRHSILSLFLYFTVHSLCTFCKQRSSQTVDKWHLSNLWLCKVTLKWCGREKMRG